MRLHFQPKQGKILDLLRATGKDVATTIGGGGAKGGGKSNAIRNCALNMAMELGELYPGVTVTIIRRVFDDLKKNHIDPLLVDYPELNPHYRSGDKELILGKSKIIFAHAETSEDVKRKFLGGYESALILVDEAQQFTEEELQWIKAACRWTGRKGIPAGLCKLALFFNPGGKSSDYIRRIFWTKHYKGKENPKDYAFIHIFGWDNYEWFRGQVDIEEEAFYQLSSEDRFNLFVTQTSEGKKYDAFPESIRAGYLLGSFDHFEGQYFAGAWDEELCTLTANQCSALIQPWWTRWMAQDWGFGDHAAHYWFAAGKVSPAEWVKHFGGSTEYSMDIVIAYREHVISNRAEADLATDICGLTPQEERKEIRRFFLSEDAFGKRAKQSGGNTVGEQFSRILTRYGLPSPETADQNRVMGWRFMYNVLRQANLRGSNISEERAKQGPAFFVSQDCPQAISNIPMAIRAEDDIDDVERVAGALWEDVCVAKGTLIATPNAWVPIESIIPGDRVWTSAGLKMVDAAGCTGRSKPTLFAVFSNGSRLQATPDHLIKTDRGFIPLKDLSVSDIIHTWTTFTTTGDDTNSPRPDTSSRAASSCIVRFGRKSADLFRRAITSITRTVSSLITASRTSNASWAPSTYPLTYEPTLGRYRQPPSSPQLSGTDRQRVLSGTRNMPIGSAERIHPVRTFSATSAEYPMRDARESSAVTTVNPQPIVRLIRVSTAEEIDVYNLSVEGTPEFFANGILVHNCDGIRYGLHSMLNPRSKAPRDVRLKQVYDSIQGDDPANVMTQRAMAVRLFKHKENTIIRARRMPGWR